MRVRVDNPTLLPDLRGYLERDGCVTLGLGRYEADVVVPGAASDWEVAQTLMMEVRLWQARHERDQVTLATVDRA